MIFFNKKLTIVAVAIAGVFSSSTFAFENANQQQDASSEISAGKFSGNFRLGYISTEDNNGDSVESSAIGGELSYSSASWNGISATGSLYTTQKLFNDDKGDFFASDGDSYAILGQAYLQAKSSPQTSIKMKWLLLFIVTFSFFSSFFNSVFISCMIYRETFLVDFFFLYASIRDGII